MKSEIKDLLLYLDSEEFDEKNIAISELASLLEMNTSIENYMDYDVRETLSNEEEIISFLKYKSEAVDQRLSEASKRVLSKLLRI